MPSPVSASELRVGEIYFAVNYVDTEMLVPTVETVVFIGRNLESEDAGQVYFQDIESNREGVAYDWNANRGSAKFQQKADMFATPRLAQLTPQVERSDGIRERKSIDQHLHPNLYPARK